MTYAHDALGRLATVTDDNGITEYAYDAIGNRKSMAYPNGTLATYEFDELNRLTYLENSGPGGLISSYEYTLGPAGNRTGIIERYREPKEAEGDTAERPVIEDECAYEYDELYRLTREARTSPEPDRTYWIEYDYDAFGNRRQMNAGGLVTAYAYDANDRLLTESAASGVTPYAWDDNGNMAGKAGPSETWAYEWDLENKMARADKDAALAAAYAYDFRGERIYKRTPDGATRFLIDNNNQTGYSQALRETDAAQVEEVAYTFGDDLISQEKAAVSFFHYDGLGSSRALSSNSGTTTNAFSYLAFGSFLFATDQTITSHLFTGDAYDFNLRYYYLRARLYDPVSGRFVSTDNFGGRYVYPKSLHKYIYTYCDPIDFTDPSGMFTLFELAIVIVIGSVILWAIGAAMLGDKAMKNEPLVRAYCQIGIKQGILNKYNNNCDDDHYCEWNDDCAKYLWADNDAYMMVLEQRCRNINMVRIITLVKAGYGLGNDAYIDLAEAGGMAVGEYLSEHNQSDTINEDVSKEAEKIMDDKVEEWKENHRRD